MYRNYFQIFLYLQKLDLTRNSHYDRARAYKITTMQHLFGMPLTAQTIIIYILIFSV